MFICYVRLLGVIILPFYQGIGAQLLTEEETIRYQRQIMIDGFREEGQEKLKQAKVVIAGIGGLGCPISLYLASAGVGTIRIIDSDRVELSNFNRQVLHWEADIGKPKVVSVTHKLSQLNANVKIEPVEETINRDNVGELISNFDVVVDATDNMPVRFLLNHAAIIAGVPLIHGAVCGLEGRAMTIIPRKSACLGCLYKGSVAHEKIPILGPTAGIIASIEALEVIKYLVGIGDLLEGRLLIYDGLSAKYTEFEVTKDPECEYCGHLAE
ncbi:ThiF family adenylyltransferase [Chloroflexota bacterium]